MTATRALNRLAKWRSVFAGWQLGTRLDSDPESQAVRDHRELTIILRAEVNALMALLEEKGILTADEWQVALEREAERLSKDYERRFPGMKATDAGIEMNIAVIQEHGTMKGWKP
jgi:hypothetical protein